MTRKIVGRILGLLIVGGAVAAGLDVWRETRINPQTDDAEVFANLIGIAPEVNGRILAINVKDNQFVPKGDVLFEVDPVPYQHSLEIARSQQATLEGQIRDRRAKQRRRRRDVEYKERASQNRQLRGCDTGGSGER